VSPDEEILYVGEGVPLSCVLLPLLPVVKVMGKTFMYIWLQPTGQHDSDHFFSLVCLVLPVCLMTQVPGSPLPAEGL
jgi:hypothetical protein